MSVSYTHLDVYKRQLRSSKIWVHSFVQKKIKLQMGSQAHRTFSAGALAAVGAGLPTAALNDTTIYLMI